MRRTIVAATLATMTLVGSSAPAVAVPGNGSGQYTFPMICEDTLSTLTIASGNWSAAFVHETGGRFIPKGTVVTVTDVVSGDLLFEETDGKPSIEDKDELTCVDAWVDDGLLITFSVTGKLR